MARREEVISIFLASPGDLLDERQRFFEVITQWNREWGRDRGVRLELLRWEDDSFPDVGEDAQDVINQQIPADWDIFVGIMWSRFGTPTTRAGSGTQEEFDRALVRCQSNPNAHLLFYFKDAAIPPSKVDANQLMKVQQFKAEVQAKGLLTADFTDTDSFEAFARLHITRHVQGILKAFETAPVVNSAVALSSEQPPVVEDGNVNSVDEEDDSGLFDLLEEFGEQAQTIQEIALRLSASQEALSQQINQGTGELNRLQASRTTVSPKEYRTAIAPVASEMLSYTARVQAEVPLLHDAFAAAMGALTKLIGLSAEVYPAQLAEMRAPAEGLLEGLTFARAASESFRDSAASLPRMTKELNQAKRKQVAALNSLIDEFSSGEALLLAALAVLNGIEPEMGRDTHLVRLNDNHDGRW